jgi:hypothetical protein
LQSADKQYNGRIKRIQILYGIANNKRGKYYEIFTIMTTTT